MELLTSDGAQFLARWVHLLAGVVWIGHLYYFNFVQGAFFNEVDAGTKNTTIQKLVPKALWWFRYGALFTFLSGLYIIAMRGHMAGFEIYTTTWGTTILLGALMGTVMFLNVWLIIWPAQKVVIQSASQVLSGGQALPAAPVCAAKAALASRTNTLLSIPMLFYMGAASHYPIYVTPEKLTSVWIAFLLIIGAIELNAIKGKMGPLTTVRGVIASGFGLTALLFIVGKVLG